MSRKSNWLGCSLIVTLSILQLIINSEIVIIQVRGEKVLSDHRLKRKTKSDLRKQEIKGVKRVEKNAKRARKDAKIGRIRREERERKQEKAYVKRRISSEEQCEKEPQRRSSKQTKKKSSTKRNELQRIREGRGSKSCLIWVWH